MALQLEKNPYDWYPGFDLSSTQSFETHSTLERSQAMTLRFIPSPRSWHHTLRTFPATDIPYLTYAQHKTSKHRVRLKTDPLLHLIHAEVMTENIPCDSRSINDPFLIQSFAIPRTSEVYPKSGHQETIYPWQSRREIEEPSAPMPSQLLLQILIMPIPLWMRL